MLFCRDTCHNLETILLTFRVYGELSSHKMSLEKTFIYFSDNCSLARKAYLLWVSGMRHGTLLFMYMGMPLFKGKPKTSFLRPIINCILHCLMLGEAGFYLLSVGFVLWTLWSLPLLCIHLCFISGLKLYCILWIKLLEIIFRLDRLMIRNGC